MSLNLFAEYTSRASLAEVQNRKGNPTYHSVVIICREVKLHCIGAKRGRPPSPTPDWCLLTRPQRSQEFQSGMGQDFAKSWDPGVFRDGINAAKTGSLTSFAHLLPHWSTDFASLFFKLMTGPMPLNSYPTPPVYTWSVSQDFG